MSTKEIVISNIKYLRSKLGMSSKELSKKIGKNEKFIAYLEMGKRQISIDLITKLASALNVKDTDLCSKIIE